MQFWILKGTYLKQNFFKAFDRWILELDDDDVINVYTSFFSNFIFNFPFRFIFSSFTSNVPKVYGEEDFTCSNEVSFSSLLVHAAVTYTYWVSTELFKNSYLISSLPLPSFLIYFFI